MGSESQIPKRIIHMIVSDKQHQANIRNARQSSGPKTQAGKEAVRFNALTYGLRTRATILPFESQADYSRLWDEFEADWQPQNRTERCYLETMVTSQWLLKRVAESEHRIYAGIDFGDKQFAMLAFVAKQRAQLERSFRTAIADMKQSQKDRQSQPLSQPAQTAPSPEPPAPSPGERSSPMAPPPDYVMSEGTDAHPAFCSPVTPDSR
jgi:hypothetical protein